MTDYYTPEELDAMPVKTELHSIFGQPWVKYQKHIWGDRTTMGTCHLLASRELGTFFPRAAS